MILLSCDDCNPTTGNWPYGGWYSADTVICQKMYGGQDGYIIDNIGISLCDVEIGDTKQMKFGITNLSMEAFDENTWEATTNPLGEWTTIGKGCTIPNFPEGVPLVTPYNFGAGQQKYLVAKCNGSDGAGQVKFHRSPQAPTPQETCYPTGTALWWNGTQFIQEFLWDWIFVLGSTVQELGLCDWIANQIGGGSVYDISITSVFDLVDSYLFQQPPNTLPYNFIPTINQVFGVIDYYLGFNGDYLTGCDFV